MTKYLDFISLGKKIRQSRIKKNITQEKLAEICELSISFIGHIERGTRKLSLESLFKISNALNVSIDFLISDSFSNDDLQKIINLLQNIKGNSEKTNSYYNIIKILAENIEKL